ncbi:MAG: FixH family protein [Flavobacteriaceae bacterium]|nr:FixH family protein [Bacteroidia bacterium]NNF75882.1 FixH family protein [Flavobacteriaceae bacterium]NNK73422.1 FixH family protein [Flavobacteriaceae bacterium]
MKLNWGFGIVIAFVLFISFIMFFVIKMNTDEKYDHDLVTEEYYKEELQYQKTIDKEANAKALKINVKWEKSNDGLLIEFPSDLDYKKITGKVFLYRPSNKQLDMEVQISLSNHYLLIPDKRLLDGRWNIFIDWQYNQTEYYYKAEIVY